MTNVVPFQPPRGVDTNDQSSLDLLKKTIVPDDITDQEFDLFVRVANHTGLDPFRRQIYAVKRQGKMTIQTGIDGYRAIAARTGVYAGQDDASFSGLSKNKQHPGTATVTVYKLVGGIRVPFTASARWDEYYPGDGGVGTMWRKMEHNQLAKCAEALALRKAFPEELSGVYVEDTMLEADPEGRTIRPDAPPKTREEQLADRYQALEVNDKVAFVAWCKREQIAKPYDDEDLDRIEVQLGAMEEAAATPVPSDDDLPGCSLCGSERTARTIVEGVVRCTHAKDCAERAMRRSEESFLCAACNTIIEPGTEPVWYADKPYHPDEAPI